jgi:hypothetical protein
MGFQKFTKGEQLTLFSPDEHRIVSDQMKRTGKTSVEQLTDEEKEALQEKLKAKE